MLSLMSKAMDLSIVIPDSELEKGLINGCGKASSSAALFSKLQCPSMPERPHSLGASYVSVDLVEYARTRCHHHLKEVLP